ncbi:hypothetical protein AB0M94_32075 [Streptomyces xanthochromogenes]|uniref:Uncharacterized protein n=1 Tax=Streptomyces xanthochromogenes TaxID=67384 RepID=A0ABQ3AQT0_9ACTN|nr:MULTISPECIES: hypothetical protein [Streptomyces]MYV94412.1 hypothetical protein [Streptomyces sp. SID1034]GGY64890.1 hypothetical protein GCM10010326_69560 [Streptomyces xanthochromogenes]GHB73689.1 hypothetical protein GCM10010331_72120 [Streptomyces xanthochromogenes]
MKSMLARVLVTSTVALTMAGLAAPAYADVAVGGRYEGVVSADEPFVAGHWAGFAGTSHVHTANSGYGWATDSATGGRESSIVVID